MNLYAVRHLPTDFNKRGILQGTIDNPISKLTVDSKINIEINNETLKKIEFDKILISQYIRTKQTAIEYGYFDFEEESLMNELNFGEYEGVLKSVLIEDSGNNWHNDMNSVQLGETLKEFEKRVAKFIEKYKKYSNVLIFSHGAFLRGLASIEKRKPFKELNTFVIEPNELNKYCFDEN